jgi:hypothetical protein
MSSDTRTRFDAKTTEARDGLFQILEKHLTIPTKIKYGTDMKTSKIEKARLITHASFLLELRALQSNMSFSKVAMKSQLKQLAESKNTSWRLSVDEVENFSSTVSDRVRCMCRHFVQASSKPHPPKWVTDIEATANPKLNFTRGAAAAAGSAAGSTAAPAASAAEVIKSDGDEPDAEVIEGEEEENEADEQEEEECEVEDDELKDGAVVEEKKKRNTEEAADDDKYFFGWDAELGYAWRVLAVDGIKGRKEPTINIVFKEGANDDDFCEACWADGSKHELPNLTVAEFKARHTARTAAARRSAEPLWSGLGYFVKAKTDRHPLVWLGKDDNKAKQICQLRVDKVSSEKEAVELLADVGRGLAEGRTTDPYALREELLAKRGVAPSSSSGSAGTMKRPAAAAVAPTAAAPAAVAPTTGGPTDDSAPVTPKKKIAKQTKAPIEAESNLTIEDTMFGDFDEL